VITSGAPTDASAAVSNRAQMLLAGTITTWTVVPGLAFSKPFTIVSSTAIAPGWASTSHHTR
jgi:hypothetical protein